MIIALLMHQHTGFGDDFFMFSKDKTECNKAQRAFPVTSAAQGPPAGDLPMENPDPHQQFSASAFNWNVFVPGAGGQHAAPNNNKDATLSQQIPMAALKKAPVPKMRASPPMIQETVSLDFHQRQLPTNVTSMDQGQQKAEKPISPHSKKALTPLPADFEPSPFSVLCGQGNENYNAVGNRRFRVTAGMFLERYKEAADRQQKSAIVKIVLEIIRQSCPVGAFIKYKDGHWWEVSEQTAREKVGTYLRDSLAEQYKSSAKSKIARRKERNSRRGSSQSSQMSASSSSVGSPSKERSSSRASQASASSSVASANKERRPSRASQRIASSSASVNSDASSTSE